MNLMHTAYNRIAGQSVERLAALSDGIFAVAMTLLVLDLRAPAVESIHSERDLLHGLIVIAPRLLMYLMSFLTLGIFWIGQQTQLNYLERSERSLTWMHILFLATIAIMPFSTSLLAEFMAYRTALVVYWLNILLPGLALYWELLGLRHRIGRDTGGNIAGGAQGRQAPYCDCAGALRFRRTPLCIQYLLEHRIHCAGAVELRDSPASWQAQQRLVAAQFPTDFKKHHY